ncbi:MAG: hypothetical protein ACLFT3_07675, partial [Cyclobacteriaceae bacterium]
RVDHIIILEGNAVLDADTIRQNIIRNATGSGILINSAVSNFSAVNNLITNNNTGITVGASLNGSITENNLANNSTALSSTSNQPVDASFNWWGSDAYASVIGSKSGNVDINPWLRTGTDSRPDLPGFQSSFSSLGIKKLSQNSDVITEAVELVSEDGLIFVYYTEGNDIVYNSFEVTKPFTIEGFPNPSFPETSAPTFRQIVTDGANLNVRGQIRVSGVQEDDGFYAMRLNNGGDIIASEGLVTLEAGTNIDEAGGQVLGTFRLAPQSVEANENLDASALGILIASGPESLGIVSITRTTGPNGVTNFGENQQYKSIAVRWTINSENQPSNDGRDIRFTWSSEFDNGIDTESAFIWRKENEDSEWELVAQDEFGIFTNELRTVTVKDVRQFSAWTVSDVNNPLPVVLTDIYASAENPHVRLNWETASEINSDFFAIERSENGLDFKEIGRIKAAGDSQSPLQYSFVDEAAAQRFEGSLFYRLRMVDFDASYEYSDIVTVFLNDENVPMISAYQDLSGSLRLLPRAIEAGDYQVRISDLKGRRIFEGKLALSPGQPLALPVENLSQSIYLLRAVGSQMVLANKFKVE